MTQFKPIEEVYPECMRESFYPGGDPCFDAPGDYVPLLESFGYDILLQVDDDDCQGDTRVLFKDGDRYGVLIFGWGSCSMCDRLQGCDSYREIDELRDSLDSDIRWGSLAETLAYLKEHDWEGDWSGRDALTSGFVERAIVVLESDDLTNTPAWVWAALERADAATPGPWRTSVSRGEHGIEQHDVVYGRCGYIAGMTAVPDAIEHAVANTTFIAAARTDIPRLIEAAAGMAEVLEQQLRDDYTDCYGGVAMMAVDCVTCQLRDDCGRSRVLKALAKWRGEAGE